MEIGMRPQAKGWSSVENVGTAAEYYLRNDGDSVSIPKGNEWENRDDVMIRVGDEMSKTRSFFVFPKEDSQENADMG